MAPRTTIAIHIRPIHFDHFFGGSSMTVIREL